MANLRRFAEKLREAMPTAKLLVLAMHFGDGIIWVANKKEVNLYILINIYKYSYNKYIYIFIYFNYIELLYSELAISEPFCHKLPSPLGTAVRFIFGSWESLPFVNLPNLWRHFKII